MIFVACRVPPNRPAAKVAPIGNRGDNSKVDELSSQVSKNE